jgi:hypothetical protein
MENFYRKHFNFDRNETEAEVHEYYGSADASARTRRGAC